MNLIDRLTFRPGCLRDYAALACYHYLRHAPVTATRVLVLEDDRPSPMDRFINREFRGQIVGVLVESLPALSCTLRNRATADRYAGWRDRSAAARLLNAEVRCISRVVIHPQWRGLGLAVKLVRRALETMTTPYTEALAAMGRVHPFFELAGMTAHRRWPQPRDQRLIDALHHAGLAAWELASVRRLSRHLIGPHAALIKHELTRWAGRNLTLDEQLQKAAAELLCDPVYYIKRKMNPTADNTDVTDQSI